MQVGGTESDNTVVWLSAHAGVAQYDTRAPPQYSSRTDLSSRVGGLNPRWNEAATDADLDERFRKAMGLTGAEFLESVDYTSQVRSSGADLSTHISRSV